MYKFAKLDLFMIKPYFKKMFLLLLAISITMMITTGNMYTISFMAVFYGIMMISYPFVLSEKNNIDNFYGTLSIDKKRIVNGRYIFSLLVLVLFSLISCACIILGSILLKENLEINETVFMLSLPLCMALILVSIQLPIFFRFGYAKGKLFTYIPFMAVALVPLVIKKFVSGNSADTLKLIASYIENNTITVSIIGILCGLVIFEISNVISQKLYLNK